jgi:hypothetical protein
MLISENFFNIVYFRNKENLLTVPGSNVFILNENRVSDTVDTNVARSLEELLECCLDEVCIYINELQDKIEDFSLKNYPYLSKNNQKNWLHSGLFSGDIESSSSKIRLIAYLHFLLKLKTKVNYNVVTDCEIFHSLLENNSIPSLLIPNSNTKWKNFFKLVLSHLVLSFSFKKKNTTDQFFFLTLSSNWIKGFDRHYGDLKGIDAKFSYIHFLSSLKHKKIFSNRSIVLNSYLKVTDIIKLVFNSLTFYFQTKMHTEKEQMVFRGMSLNSLIRDDFLELSLTQYFSGAIYTLSIFNFYYLQQNRKTVLITYGEMFPINRYLYNKLRSLAVSPEIVAIQHAVNFKRKIVNTRTEHLNNDELPDHYLVHGPHYAAIIKDLSHRINVKITGCLKYDGISYENLDRVGKEDELRVLLTPSLNDLHSILEPLQVVNPMLLRSMRVYLSPHPAANLAALKESLSKIPINIEILSNVSSLAFAKSCDIIIFSYSSVGFESLFYNKKIIRVYSKKLPKLFDDDNRVPTASGVEEFQKCLTSNENTSEEIIKFYFGYTDGKVYDRVSNFLNELSKN